MASLIRALNPGVDSAVAADAVMLKGSVNPRRGSMSLPGGWVPGHAGEAPACPAPGPIIDKPAARRFPPPWIAEETDACFIIRDHNGYALAYVYFEDEPGRRSAAPLLTRDEARRIAANIAKLTELLAR